MVTAFTDDIRGDDTPGIDAQAGQQPLDERFGHIAAAEKGKAHIFDRGHLVTHRWRSGRGPNMAVPTLTSVAPSSIATS